MDGVTFTLAFSAGLLSFLSPCVLPLVPAYIAYLAGMDVTGSNTSNSNLQLFYKAAGFVIGFTIIFVILGASASSIGSLFSEHRAFLRKAGGVVIILLGLHTAGLFRLKALDFEKRLIHLNNKTRLGSVFIGMAFALGWTPCIGPILSAILFYAGNMETVASGIILLIVYSSGLAIPFLLSSLAMAQFTRYQRKFSRYMVIIPIASGILLVLTGILIFTNKLAALSPYLNFINYY